MEKYLTQNVTKLLDYEFSRYRHWQREKLDNSKGKNWMCEPTIETQLVSGRVSGVTVSVSAALDWQWFKHDFCVVMHTDRTQILSRF